MNIPIFPKANLFLANAMMHDLPQESVPSENPEEGMAILSGPEKKGFVRDVKRELSNSRIVAAGLEMIPLKWTIGNKVYETGKIRVFLEALWQRMRSFERGGFILVRGGEEDRLVQAALHVTENIRQIKKGWDQKIDTLATATALFNLLNKTSTLFLEIYFRGKLFHSIRENRI